VSACLEIKKDGRLFSLRSRRALLVGDFFPPFPSEDVFQLWHLGCGKRLRYASEVFSDRSKPGEFLPDQGRLFLR